MCTLTWFVRDEGYDLFFNRDERTSRSRAEKPRLHNNSGVDYLSPVDADAGGTWIASNHFGLTVCLLNHYQFEQIETYKEWVSRGEVVRRFATVATLAEADTMFAEFELDDYRAFRMFIIEPEGNNRLMIWDGHSPRVESNVSQPKSSSSVDAMHVKKMRRDLFNNLGLSNSKNVNDYINYHASHLPNRSKESVCMHREDASTVSLSHVSVSAERVYFSYADGSPCEAELGEPITLELVTKLQSSAAKLAAFS